jgi:hypothetical protein
MVQVILEGYFLSIYWEFDLAEHLWMNKRNLESVFIKGGPFKPYWCVEYNFFCQKINLYLNHLASNFIFSLNNVHKASFIQELYRMISPGTNLSFRKYFWPKNCRKKIVELDSNYSRFSRLCMKNYRNIVFQENRQFCRLKFCKNRRKFWSYYWPLVQEAGARMSMRDCNG